MKLERINDIKIVFIVGIGRSGTTLLQSIMNVNQYVSFPHESRLILYLKQKYLNQKEWTDNLIIEFISDLYRNKKFRMYW